MHGGEKSEELIFLGKISGVHGLKGELKVQTKHHLLKEEPIYVDIDGRSVPFFITHVKSYKQGVVLKLQGIDTQEQATAMRGHSVYGDTDVYEQPEEDASMESFIGFTVRDIHQGILGEVTNIYVLPGHELIAVFMQEKEVLIPFNEAIVKHIDEKNRTLETELPEGLIDIFLE